MTQATDLGDRGQTWRLLQHGDDFIHAGLHPGQLFMLHLGSRTVTSNSRDNLTVDLRPTEMIKSLIIWVFNYLPVGLLAMLPTLEEMR